MTSTPTDAQQPSLSATAGQPSLTPAVDPFIATTRGLDDPHPARASLRAAGPIVQVPAPAGGHVWIVTDDVLARHVLVHPGIVKDPACAPAGWDPRAAGLEPTAAEQPSLTTTDGPGHTRLRQAHSPLFTARRMAAFTGRVTALARDLLARAAASGDPVDLAADFTTRYPLSVVCDVLGVPLERVDEAISACRRMYSDDPEQVGQAMAAFADLAAAALENGRDGLAAQLLDNLREDARPHIHYLLFTLIYAGQLTTDPSLGFLLARALDRPTPPSALDDLVRDTLRRHSPAPFTLWRFAAEDLDLAGVRLAARSPILIDIQGINTDPERSIGADLVFGAGPHYCTGAHLAQLELRILVEVLQEEYPDARLAVPYSELRQTDFGGIQGSRITSLPVRLHG
ncbi:cytochrome P450 [Nonomuraea typhae]|uniref:Cytochrome P450 n=1 Tax=Nonomuraea typhae TaxID=2603600 RepID=A0ABW7YW15_9ACTN